MSGGPYKELAGEELEAALADLPGWRVGDGEILKQYKFGDFRQAIGFINRLADEADALDHHPDLENHYNRVRVAMHTWSQNAVTERDVELAKRIEGVSTPEVTTG